MKNPFSKFWNSDKSMTTSSPSNGELWALKIFSYALIAAGGWINIQFWIMFAVEWSAIFSHFLIAVATTSGTIAGTSLLIRQWKAGNAIGAFGGLAIMFICAGVNIMNATGFYSAEEEKSVNQVTAVSKGEALNSDKISSLKARLEALQNNSPSMNSELVALEQQKAEFAKRNVITMGVKPTQAKIDALKAQLETSKGDRLKEAQGVQAELNAAIQEAKTDIVSGSNVGLNPAGALFRTLAKARGTSPEEARAHFFVWLPIIHEVLVLLGSLMLHASLPSVPAPALKALQSSPDRNESDDPPSWVRAFVQRLDALERGASASNEPAFSNNAAAATPRPRVQAIPRPEPEPESTQEHGDYIAELFKDWTPEQRRLTGRNKIATRLGLSNPEATRMHRIVRSSPHYSVRGNNQSFSDVDEAAFRASLTA